MVKATATSLYGELDYNAMSVHEKQKLSRETKDLDLFRNKWLDKHASVVTEFAVARRVHGEKVESMQKSIDEITADLAKIESSKVHAKSVEQINKYLTLLTSSLNDAKAFKSASTEGKSVSDVKKEVESILGTAFDADKVLELAAKEVDTQLVMHKSSHEDAQKYIKGVTEDTLKAIEKELKDLSKDEPTIDDVLTAMTANIYLEGYKQVSGQSSEARKTSLADIDRVKTHYANLSDEKFLKMKWSAWTQQYDEKKEMAGFAKENGIQFSSSKDAVIANFKKFKADTEKAETKNEDLIKKLTTHLETLESSSLSKIELDDINADSNIADTISAYVLVGEKFDPESLNKVVEKLSAVHKVEEVKVTSISELTSEAINSLSASQRKRFTMSCNVEALESVKTGYAALKDSLKTEEFSLKLKKTDKVTTGKYLDARLSVVLEENIISKLDALSETIKVSAASSNKKAMAEIELNADAFITKVTAGESEDAKKNADSYKEIFNSVLAVKDGFAEVRELVDRANSAEADLADHTPTWFELLGLNLDINPKYATASNMRMLIASLALLSVAFIPGVAAAAVPFIYASSGFLGYATTLRVIQQLSAAKESSLFAPSHFANKLREGKGWNQYFKRALYMPKKVQAPLTRTLIAGVIPALLAPLSGLGVVASSVAAVLRNPAVLFGIGGSLDTASNIQRSWINSSLELPAHKASPLASTAAAAAVASDVDATKLEIVTKALDSYDTPSDTIKAGDNDSKELKDAVTFLTKFVELVKSTKTELKSKREVKGAKPAEIKLDKAQLDKLSDAAKLVDPSKLGEHKKLAESIKALLPSEKAVVVKANGDAFNKANSEGAMNLEKIARGLAC